ncbi:MAG: hypothetical protein CMA12_08345 [Euryarchaeota archaeon]|nr:hypothetical protein [Euryarchaeota archaeon]
MNNIEDSILNIFEEGNWYHTVGYKDTFSKGTFNYTSLIKQLKFPSMEGLNVLDVGCSDGFFSKYFIESLNAKYCLGVDYNKYDDSVAFEVINTFEEDYQKKYLEMNDFMRLKINYENLGLNNSNKYNFLKKVFDLNIDFETGSIYDLKKYEKFDVTFCGSLLEHLRDPITAIEQLYFVTEKYCIIDISNSYGKLISYLNLPLIKYTGAGGNFFHHSSSAIKLMMETVGFKNIKILNNYKIKIEKYGYYIPHSLLIGYR